MTNQKGSKESLHDIIFECKQLILKFEELYAEKSNVNTDDLHVQHQQHNEITELSDQILDDIDLIKMELHNVQKLTDGIPNDLQG
ncbi:hypothetical protein GZH47_28080 [Paenibacillus rhizovicinus]|uniref:Uncharacterized protein n=1 Tax=Paenibacillus rhizovicinus TaxID=2704463 RepID=A0A6C0P7B7_9BACL|nr:hypothetical protein [Paenibacillus rhizovicinus]QHW34275.1 hypothetical protein GZH47_28080 [Paenibacillus rhizovicinus]